MNNNHYCNQISLCKDDLEYGDYQTKIGSKERQLLETEDLGPTAMAGETRADSNDG